MNYEIVKITREGNVEIAYLFDRAGGRLIKTLVEDRTGGHSAPMEVIYEPSVREDAMRPYVPSVTPRKDGGFIPTGIASGQNRPVPRTETPRMDLPDKPAYSPPPPGLGQMFREGNEVKLVGGDLMPN